MFLMILIGLGALTAGLAIGELDGHNRGWDAREADYRAAAETHARVRRESPTGHDWPQWGDTGEPAAEPRAFFRWAFSIRLHRPDWLRREVLTGAAARALGTLSLGLLAEPAPPVAEIGAARFIGRAAAPAHPWDMPYRLDADGPRGGRHAAEPDADPTTTGEFWQIVAGLADLGVKVDPLALPCSHCQGAPVGQPHRRCPGCACPCGLKVTR